MGLKKLRKLIALLLVLLMVPLAAPAETIEGEQTMPNPFGTEITTANWVNFYGTAEVITEQSWRQYIDLLIRMSNEGRLKYASAYTNGTTSLKYYKGTLYLDCLGLIKAGAKLILTREALSTLVLDGPVNSIFRQLKETGPVTAVVEKGETSYPGLRTGYTVFIDMRKEQTDESGSVLWSGYDHCMTYIENLTYTNSKGKEISIQHALVGVGSGEGLQVYDLDRYINRWTARGYTISWGNQLNIDYGDGDEAAATPSDLSNLVIEQLPD